MKKIFLMTMLAMLVLGVKAQDNNDDIVKVGEMMPSFSIVSDNGTKITPALRKMPLTDLRHTIGTGDLFHKQTNIW